MLFSAKSTALALGRRRRGHKARPSAIAALQRLFARWASRARTRAELLKLDDRSLHDLGLTTSDRDREARRWFWQAYALHGLAGDDHRKTRSSR